MCNDVKTLFSDRFQHLRKQSGLTQSALASVLNVRQSTVTSYELADKFPKPDMLMKIAKHFGVSVDYLLGNVDHPYISVGFDKVVTIVNNRHVTIADLLSDIESMSVQGKQDLCAILFTIRMGKKEDIERLLSAIRIMIDHN